MSTVIIDNYNLSNLPREAFTAKRLRFRFYKQRMDQRLFEPLVAIRGLKSAELSGIHGMLKNDWFVEFIKANPEIESVKLSKIIIGPDLVNALSGLTNLKKLKTRTITYVVPTFGMFVSLIEKATMLEEFSSRDTHEMKGIHRALAHHKTLKRLSIDGRINIDGLYYILKKSTSLTHLTFLMTSNICSSFDRCVKEIMRDYPNIVVNYECLKLLCDNEEEDFSVCTYLRTYEDLPSIDFIERKLMGVPRLTHLEIYDLNPETIPSYITIMRGNPNISHVTIYSFLDKHVLCEFLDNLAYVTRLTFVRSSWGSEAQVVFDKLRGHEHLERLDVQPNIMCNVKSWTLLDLVKTMPRLYHLCDPSEIPKITPDMVEAKRYCQVRKHNHKTYEPTLTSRLLTLV